MDCRGPGACWRSTTGRSFEAEVRNVLAKALESEPVTIVDLLSMVEGADIEFEPERLGLTARTAEL